MEIVLKRQNLPIGEIDRKYDAILNARIGAYGRFIEKEGRIEIPTKYYCDLNHNLHVFCKLSDMVVFIQELDSDKTEAIWKALSDGSNVTWEE